eukprot:gene38832-44015_t
MKNSQVSYGLALCGAIAASAAAPAAYAALKSPDGHLAVSVRVQQSGVTYAISRDGKPVLLPSALGLKLEGADFTQDLVLAGLTAAKPVSDKYQMAVGKRRSISYAANEQVYTLRNAQKQTMEVAFRVSNDGVAFRYIKVISESTSFAFAKSAQGWLQPMSVAQTGWKNTNPSYEEHYQMGIP